MTALVPGSTITFTLYGQARADRLVAAIQAAARNAAAAIVVDYEDRVQRALRPHRSVRNMDAGHLAEDERPHLMDYVRGHGMGTVRVAGSTIWGAYGYRPTLDALRPGYRRGVVVNKSWQPLGPVMRDGAQSQHPIWMLVEYGTGGGSITPRSDRRMLRYIHEGAEHFVTGTRHPGVFRRNTVPLPVLVSQVAANLGANENFGVAPFRRSHYEVMAAAPAHIGTALGAVSPDLLRPRLGRR